MIDDMINFRRGNSKEWENAGSPADLKAFTREKRMNFQMIVGIILFAAVVCALIIIWRISFRRARQEAMEEEKKEDRDAEIQRRAKISSAAASSPEETEQTGDAGRQSRVEHFRARHDSLTGAYNKEYFCDAARKLLDDNPDREYFILLSDVRNFKMINELFGRETGDRVLIRISELLAEHARPEAVYARYTDDRFAVIAEWEGFDPDLLTKRIHDDTYLTGDLTYPVVIHTGIYKITERDLPVTAMVDRAQMALNGIKNEYNTRIAYYDEKLRDDIVWEQKITGELDEAIAEGQIRPFLQPQMNADGCMEGAEVLVRWLHPTEGLLPPGRFLPFFEKNGMIAEVDACIWEQACRILAKWKREGRTSLYLSINISPKDFFYMDVYQTITDLVKKYDIDIRNLHLEITETVMLTEMEQRLALIQRLQSDGFKVEMDDFGSGYSSLNMLKDIPVDVLKIDMVFLRKTQYVDKAKEILRSIIEMSYRLGIGAITEGVETREQLDMLTEMGCRMFQGYYFSKPIPLDEFEEKYLGESA